EAQRIKNWSTRTARSVKKITSPYAIVLTGTPLENRLEELVSIVQFVDRYRLGPTFKLLHDHQMRDEVGKVVGYRDLDRIGKTLEPVLLRRQKDQVLDQLPERLDKHFFVPMTPQQKDLHEENREIMARIVQKWRRYRFLTEADQRRLMAALQNMRMSCNSTYLLDRKTDHGVKADELATLLEEVTNGRTSRWSCSASGCACTSSSFAGSKPGSRTMSCSTPARLAIGAGQLLTAFVRTRAAGRSCPPMRAAWV